LLRFIAMLFGSMPRDLHCVGRLHALHHHGERMSRAMEIQLRPLEPPLAQVIAGPPRTVN
jgi:hypothetical protein